MTNKIHPYPSNDNNNHNRYIIEHLMYIELRRPKQNSKTVFHRGLKNTNSKNVDRLYYLQNYNKTM